MQKKKSVKKGSSKKSTNKSKTTKAPKKIDKEKIIVQKNENVSKQLTKNKSKKKFFIIFGSILGVGAIAGAGVGIYFAAKPKAAEVKIETPTIEGLTFTNQEAYIGQDYNTEISIDITKTGERRLPAKLISVQSGDNPVPEYTYDVAENKETAKFEILGKYVIGNIKIDLELEIPVAKYEVSLIGDDKGNLTLTGSAAYTDKNFSETISINRVEPPKKFMPGALEPSKVLCLGNQIKFTYKAADDKQSATIDIPSSEIKGDITIEVKLEDCQHKYSSYTVKNNQLYGICEKCSEQVLISDKELEGEEYKNKILVVDNQSNKNETTYTMYDISAMSSIISKAEKSATLKMYLIVGEYNLDGSRQDGTVTVELYGLNNNEGEANATVCCTKAVPGPFPREYDGINFVMNNLNMKGERRYDSGFYFGLYANTITYNYCHFDGKQTAYSSEVIFNNCKFDSTNFDDSPDYAIYIYSSQQVKFNDCDFISDGKAVKIYRDGPNPKASMHFTNCNFEIGELVNDEHPAIQVDSTYQSAQEEDYYQVYIKHCNADERYNTNEEHESGDDPLYGDSATPSRTQFHLDEEN